MDKSSNITVIGAGYVGFSLSVLLATKHKVSVLEINKNKVNMINNGKSTIDDLLIDKYMENTALDLVATSKITEINKNTDIFIIATPTDFDEKDNYFDTSSVDSSVDKIHSCFDEPFIVIKSTLPIGHTKYLREKYNNKNIIFSPEFLREGRAIEDNLYPSRIILGDNSSHAELFAKILKEISLKDDVEIIYTSSTEAEAIKLFANSYLALRVAFFNEVDTYSMMRGLDPLNLIKGICSEPRIGDGYNNPSFGYGGYCLPKDASQLLASYEDMKTPQSIISAIISSNSIRKEFLVNEIVKQNPKKIGFYRLIMKSGSQNFRSSAITDLILAIKKYEQFEMSIYEPMFEGNNFLGIQIENDIHKFKRQSDLVIANRIEENILDIQDKVFTRDIFGEN